MGKNYLGRKDSVWNMGHHRISHDAIHASNGIGYSRNFTLNQQSPENRETIPPDHG